VGFGAKYVGEQEHIALPIHVERLVQTHLCFQARGLSQMHEDLVLYAPRGECGEFYVLVGLEAAHRLDQPDSAYRDEVLKVYARVVEAFCYVDYKAEIALDEF